MVYLLVCFLLSPRGLCGCVVFAFVVCGCFCVGGFFVGGVGADFFFLCLLV